MTRSRRQVVGLIVKAGFGVALWPLAACSPAPVAPSAPALAPAQPATSPAKAPEAPAASAPPVAPAASPAAAAPVASPAAAAPAAKPTAGPLVPVTRTINSQAFVAGISDFWAGKYLGYYEEEGVDPEMQGTQGAAQGVQFLLTGKSQFAEAVQDGLLGLAGKGEKPAAKMVYNHTRGMVNQVGVLPDSPIQAHKDLKGKKIGVFSLAHPGVNYLRTVLKEVGLNVETDVDLIGVGQGAQAGTALRNGDVAAIVLWDTEYVLLANAGFKTRQIPYPESVKSITGGQATAVTTDFLKNNRKVVVGTMRAQAKTTVFRLVNPTALVQIHWKMYPQSRPQGKPEEQALKEEVDSIMARNPKIEPKTYRLKFGEFDPKGWKAYADFLGVGDAINVNDWFTNELIDEINAFDRARIEEQARTFKL